MILANNVLYSRDKNAMNFPNGKKGVTIAGNIVIGDGAKDGTKPGRGLEDFVHVTWDGEHFDALPTASAPFEFADLRDLVETDFSGKKRIKPMSGDYSR